MSPEQIQGLTVDSRSDLYSLGATAFHMLSGRPPFSGETALALAMQHLQAEVPSLATLRPDLPPALVKIVHKLLAKSPDERFASAMELARALREVVDSSLAGQVDQMIPFAGLVIEHQHVSHLEVTQQLQKLTNAASQESKSRWVIARSVKRVAIAGCSVLVGIAGALYLMRNDLLSMDARSTAGVQRQPTIQRQFALALIENDLKHWRGVSEYFPGKDATTRNYELKAELQIARLAIEGENYPMASESLTKVINSQFADDVLRTIARIEMGYVANKLMGQLTSNEFYNAASRDMKIMQATPDKQRLIRDSLPNRVREEWDRNDYAKQSAD
jgi:serine/threonine-protein kinase